MEVINDFLFFVVSLMAGSFANNVISHYVHNSKFDLIRSRCLCGERNLKFFELIPLFSYLYQNGKCTRCNKKISIRYFLVEIVFGIVGLVFYSKLGFTIQFILGASIAFLLIVIAIIDLIIYRIPNLLIIILLILWLWSVIIINTEVVTNIIASLSLLIFFLLANGFSKKIIYKDTVGYGDIKLISILALISGLRISLITIWIASLIAIPSFQVMKKLNFKSKGEIKIPFGFFLCTSFILITLNQNFVNSIFKNILAVMGR